MQPLSTETVDLQRQKKLLIEIGNLLEGPLFYSKAYLNRAPSSVIEKEQGKFIFR